MKKVLLPKYNQNLDDKEINSQKLYNYSNKLLFALFIQITVIIVSFLPVSCAVVHFIQFQFIFNGFSLKFGPIFAVCFSLIFGMIVTFWQFSHVLSIR